MTAPFLGSSSAARRGVGETRFPRTAVLQAALLGDPLSADLGQVPVPGAGRGVWPAPRGTLLAPERGGHAGIRTIDAADMHSRSGRAGEVR